MNSLKALEDNCLRRKTRSPRSQENFEIVAYCSILVPAEVGIRCILDGFVTNGKHRAARAFRRGLRGPMRGRFGNRFWFHRGDSDAHDRGNHDCLGRAGSRRTERQIVERLSGVVEVLGGPSFPLTDVVLARMHSLSGARFVAYGRAGQPVAASDPELASNAPASRPFRSAAGIDSTA